MDIQAYLLHETTTCVRITSEGTPSNRTPVHFCVLCDVSGSMDEDAKIGNVKQSLHYIINILTKDDYMSIITFSSKAKVVVPCMQVNEENKAIIQGRIQSIVAGGGTNLSDGLYATRECLRNDLPQHKQGILLLTDGQNNEGIKDTSGLLGLTRAIVREYPGITISSVGYGTDHNVDLLQSIAVENSGSYNLVENAEHVASVFGDILGGLVSCTFMNVAVKVPADAEQITSYPREGNSIQIGDMRSQSNSTILLRNCGLDASITIKGYSIQTETFIDKTLEVQRTEDNTLLRHGLITMHRIDVVEIMERLRKAILGRTLIEQKVKLLEDIKRHKDAIQLQITMSGEDPILALLIDELTTCETTINTHMNSLHNVQHATHILSQHATTIRMGRGIRHDATPGRPHHISIPSPHANVFSNALQRTISESIHSSTVVDTPTAPVHTVVPALPALPGSIAIRRVWDHDPTDIRTPVQSMSPVVQSDSE